MKDKVIRELMKNNSISLTNRIRILRRYEKKAKELAREKRMSNSSVSSIWSSRNVEYHRQRKIASVEARYNHLARMYLKGVPYDVVERSTRAGNEPDAGEIRNVLLEWGVRDSTGRIDCWLLSPW